MLPRLAFSHWGASTDWHDYVGLFLFVCIAPLLWFAVRGLWRSIPDQQPERMRTSMPTKPRDEFRIVTIATYMNDLQADTALATLETAGIPAFIQRGDCAGMRPWLRLATGGLQLKVTLADAPKAAALLGREITS